MPTYQYRCTECGSDLEAVQSFSDAALTECPSCGGRLRKVFGNVGVVFKGSGFYKTDSRANGKGRGTEKPAEKKESTPAASGSGDSSASTSSTSGSSSSSSGSSGDSGSSSTGSSKNAGAAA